ncbi:MAG: hypothetical protein IPM42_13345 [Saprospiraceae bacterium]|nr:hypothetical protein [Saprospiraceae bacterium]
MLWSGAHAATQGGISAAQGGNFWQGALSGGIGSGISSGIDALGGAAGHQILGGGLGGGIGSAMSGGNFWQGLGQGIAVGAFNHALHNGLNGGPDDPPSSEDFKKSPPNHPDYKAPKSGPRWIKDKNNQRGYGWEDSKCRVWIPTDHKGSHAPHWDVQRPGGYDKVYPIQFRTPSISFRDKIAIATGLTGTALTVYIIISEGSRIIPARNLIPIQ